MDRYLRICSTLVLVNRSFLDDLKRGRLNNNDVHFSESTIQIVQSHLMLTNCQTFHERCTQGHLTNFSVSSCKIRRINCLTVNLNAGKISCFIVVKNIHFGVSVQFIGIYRAVLRSEHYELSDIVPLIFGISPTGVTNILRHNTFFAVIEIFQIGSRTATLSLRNYLRPVLSVYGNLYFENCRSCISLEESKANLMYRAQFIQLKHQPVAFSLALAICRPTGNCKVIVNCILSGITDRFLRSRTCSDILHRITLSAIHRLQCGKSSVTQAVYAVQILIFIVIYLNHILPTKLIGMSDLDAIILLRGSRHNRKFCCCAKALGVTCHVRIKGIDRLTIQIDHIHVRQSGNFSVGDHVCTPLSNRGGDQCHINRRIIVANDLHGNINLTCRLRLHIDLQFASACVFIIGHTVIASGCRSNGLEAISFDLITLYVNDHFVLVSIQCQDCHIRIFRIKRNRRIGMHVRVKFRCRLQIDLIANKHVSSVICQHKASDRRVYVVCIYSSQVKGRERALIL